MKKYQKLIHLEMYCTRYDVLMVASCPNTSETVPQHVRIPPNAHNNSEVSFFNKDTFHSIIENRPVTNLETGIVFKNQNIYDCNNEKKSNFIFWQPYFANLALNFSIMREEKRALDFIAYVAPYDILDLTYCTNKAVNSCNDTKIVLPIDEHKFFTKMCTSIKSYLKIVYQINERITYQNRYCLVCNEGYGDFKLFYKRHHTAQFQILFHMDVNSTVRHSAK